MPRARRLTPSGWRRSEPEGASAPTVPVLDQAALLREGEYWVFAVAGDVTRLRDSKGVRYRPACCATRAGSSTPSTS